GPGWKGTSGADGPVGASEPAGRGRRALSQLLCWIGVSGLAWFWLPAGLHDLSRWPLVTVCGVALWWYLTARGHRRGTRETSRSSARPQRPDTPGPPDGPA